MLQGYFQLNTLPVGIIVYMIVMIWVNRNYEPDITYRFKFPISMLLCLILDDNLDYYFFEIGDITLAHVATAVIGYNLRINILLSMVFIVLRNEYNKYKWFITIPAMLCGVLTCLAFFTKLVFWYDSVTGEICRGSLAYTPHITAVLYVCLLLYYGIRALRAEKVEEGAVIIIGCVLNTLCTLVEMLFALRGILMGSIATIIVFYYLHIHTEAFKIDSLTGAFNRLTMRADLDKYKDTSKYMIMIDLNNLKVINDKYGHDAGDIALKTLASKVRSCLDNGCYLYRIGGDEFVVLCTSKCNLDIDDLVDKIQWSMKDTGYTWAVGYASFDNKQSVAEVYKKADAAMYSNKSEMKRGGTV